MMNSKSASSLKPYLVVISALAVLTLVTVGLSYMHLEHTTAVILASLIALTKCSLIAAVFMHLRHESKTIYAIILSALFFVAVLVLAIIPDIGLVD
jgi:caa(3)-type oxidase subunit IV